MTPGIRDGAAADGDAIARLHAESWRDTYRGLMPDSYLDGPVYADRAALWRGRLDAPAEGAILLVAEREGSLAGFVYLYPDPEAERYMLDNLHVAAPLRSVGLGTRLMRAAAGALGRLGSDRVVLYVIEGNVDACRFYERHGGVRQAIELERIAGEGPFRMIPYAWEDFPALANRG